MSPSEAALGRLLEVMRRLRDPVSGCPWDLAQSHETIAPYTIEEAYETQDAILREDVEDTRDELGDLLFQVVFQSQIAHERGAFDFADVADAIADKMVRRHPHIFERPGESRDDLAWEDVKAAERAEKNDAVSALDGVAATLPATTRAYKLQRRAARVGFDFPNWRDALEKTKEELQEVIEAAPDGGGALHEEVGDLLFAAINLARLLNIDPDIALRDANAKFDRRFREMEALLEQVGSTAEAASLEEQESAWIKAKASEKATSSANE